MGLLRMAARTAVVAGTATAVSGRVAHRQNEKWAAQEQDQYDQQQAQQAQQQQAYQEAPPEQDSTAELQNLAQLHSQGVLTDEEFAAAKAKILGI
jgi:membrane protease subunit (stomatin/prohibitin family)